MPSCLGMRPQLGRDFFPLYALQFFWNSLSHAHVKFMHTKRLIIKLFKNLKSMNSVIIIKCIEASWQFIRETVLRGQRSPFSDMRLDSVPILCFFITAKVFFFFALRVC